MIIFNDQFFSNLISSLLGTIAGAVVAYWFALRQIRIKTEAEARKICVDNTLDFYKELTSHDFAEARVEADKILESYINASSFDEFWPTMQSEKKKPILRVLSYFKRMQLFIEYGRIDNQMALDLFSAEFLMWYFTWLNELIPSDWESRNRIDKLNYWLQINMNRKEYDQQKSNMKQRKTQRIKELRYALQDGREPESQRGKRRR